MHSDIFVNVVAVIAMVVFGSLAVWGVLDVLAHDPKNKKTSESTK